MLHLNHTKQVFLYVDDKSPDVTGIRILSLFTSLSLSFFFFSFFSFLGPIQSFKVVFREPLPSQQQPSNSPPPQLVSMYHHLESVINTACYNLWTGLL